jgi:hypothetical protein
MRGLYSVLARRRACGFGVLVLAATLFGVALGVRGVARAQDGETDEEPDVPVASPSTPPPAGTVGPGQAAPAAVRGAWSKARNLPISPRLENVSEPLLGARYLLDPLGEGEVTDGDPLVRYDSFDCLTFVEEVLAITLSASSDHAAAVRLGLRYGDARPKYAARHHFMELQWVPEALRWGYLRDTTAEYGTTFPMEKTVDAAAWDRWPARGKFAIPDAALPSGVMRLDVLPLERAIAVAQTVRPGSVLATVRADRPATPLWITHIGVVVGGERPRYRHASRMATKRVTDHDLKWYLQYQRTYKDWPVVGVVVFEPREYGPRISRLPVGARP